MDFKPRLMSGGKHGSALAVAICIAIAPANGVLAQSVQEVVTKGGQIRSKRVVVSATGTASVQGDAVDTGLRINQPAKPDLPGRRFVILSVQGHRGVDEEVS